MGALAERWAVRRYGFHGISGEYLVERLQALDPGRRRVILCHLGAGASVTAVRDGRSMDTSIDRVPGLGSAAAYAKQELRDKLVDHQDYVTQRGEDLPEVRDWRWSRG